MNRWSMRSGLLGSAFLLGVVACATAQQEEFEGNVTGGSAGTGGSGGASGGTGGTTTGGTGTTTGGTGTTTGGTGTTTGGTGTTTGGTTATGGAGGTGTTGACSPQVGPATDVLIDDFEDLDNGIIQSAGRYGFWYSYNDMTGTQSPAPGDTVEGAAGGSSVSPMGALHTTGTGFTEWGAGIGVSLNQAMSTDDLCTYNAAAYTGIQFSAKAASPIELTVKVGIPATVARGNGGTCQLTICESHSYAADVGTSWTSIKVPFTSLAQAAWVGEQCSACVVTFSKAQLLQIQFQTAAAVNFDYWIDDLSFY